MSSSEKETEALLGAEKLKLRESLSVRTTQPTVQTPIEDEPVDAEVESLEEDIRNSSERFRKSKATGISSAESGSSATKIKGKKLIFQDIKAAAVKKDGSRQEILKKVSGTARPGELTFIMGSSGAGKTTLLNILTGRNLKKIETGGDVIVNGRSMRSVEMKKLSAYVQQDDVFIGMLTVRETLRFAAKLRSPKKLDKEELDDIVDELLVMMSLKKCENTKVGSITEKSLSRGERKRLAFACEILTDPPILFCDEPTSGLDSFMSHQVIKALRQLTTEGKTIVCTIHQPSTSVFHMAHQLILLSQGHVAYAGPAKEVDAFFARCGYTIPKFVSSADHFMKVISQKSHESEQQYTQRIDKIVEEHETMINEKTGVSSQTSSRRDQCAVDTNTFPRTWWCQFFYLFHRSAVQLYRERAVLLVKLIQTLIMGFMIGSTYFGLTIHKDTLMSFKGFAFVTIQMMHMLFLMPAMTVFWKDWPVVVREYHSNMYSPSAYYLAKTTADSIQYLVFPVIFSVILLAMTDLSYDPVIIANYVTVNILLSLNACSLSQAFAAICGSLATGMTILPILAVPLMVFGGFMISYDAIPIYFKPIAYLSWYKYGFEAITIVYFRNEKHIEGCAEETNNSTSVISRLVNSSSSTESPQTSSVLDGLEDTCSNGVAFIESQAFSVSNLWIDYAAIITALVVWKVIGIVAFTIRCRRN